MGCSGWLLGCLRRFVVEAGWPRVAARPVGCWGVLGGLSPETGSRVKIGAVWQFLVKYYDKDGNARPAETLLLLTGRAVMGLSGYRYDCQTALFLAGRAAICVIGWSWGRVVASSRRRISATSGGRVVASSCGTRRGATIRTSGPRISPCRSLRRGRRTRLRRDVPGA